jgi:UDP-glucose 4-epimerase
MAFDDLSSGKSENLRAGIALIVGDVCNRETVGGAASGGIDCAFDPASQIDVRKAVDNLGLDAQADVGGTINVLNACVEAHVGRLVSSTGGALYGEPSNPLASEQPLLNLCALRCV